MQINQERQVTNHKSENLSKVDLSPYDSVQKSELYAILMVLRDFKESLNIVMKKELFIILRLLILYQNCTSLFIQVQDIIRNRHQPIYETHIQSHIGLLGPLAQGNAEINQLLIGNVLKASEFHKNIMSIAKVFFFF